MCDACFFSGKGESFCHLYQKENNDLQWGIIAICICWIDNFQKRNNCHKMIWVYKDISRKRKESFEEYLKNS